MGNCPGGEWTYNGELSLMKILPGGELYRWGSVLVGSGPSRDLSWWEVVQSGDLFWWVGGGGLA